MFKEQLLLLLVHCRDIDSPESDWNRMASICLVTCCLLKVLGNVPLRLETTSIAEILEALMLTVDVENRKCPGIDFLLQDLPAEMRYITSIDKFHYCFHFP